MRRLVLSMLAGCAARPAPAPSPASPKAPAEPIAARDTPAAAPAPIRPTTMVIRCAGAQGRACTRSRDGFVVVHPSPVAVDLRDVHVTPDGEAWIVGEHGTLLRVKAEGGAWVVRPIAIPDLPTVAKVFDDLERDLGGEAHAASVPPSAQAFPGTQYMPLDLDAVVATSSRDVWIAVGGEELVHWDGKRWSHHPQANGAAGDALMIAADRAVWAWGGLGGVLGTDQEASVLSRADGGWRSSRGPTLVSNARVRAVARQGDDVWAAGFDGLLARSRAGAQFQLVDPPDSSDDYRALWLDPDGEAGLLATHNAVLVKDGDRFVPGPKIEGTINDVFAPAGGSPAWVVGDWAHVLEAGVATEMRIDGFTPPRKSYFRLTSDRMHAVHGRAPDDVWIVGWAGLILHWDGDTLRELSPRLTEADFVGLAWVGERGWLALAEDGFFIEGDLDHGATSVFASPLKDPRALVRLGDGTLLVHEMCDKLRVRDADDRWRELPDPPGCAKRIAGRSPDDLWAIGSRDLVDGKVWHLGARGWSAVRTGVDKDLRAVAVTPDGDVWIAGDGVILHARKGKRLRVAARHPYDDYRDIAIEAPDDLWIVGDSNDIGSAGLALHWNGRAFTRHEQLTANFLKAATLGPGGELWAVGLGGVATRHDGTSFQIVDVGGSATLEHVAAHASGTILALGEAGTILQRDPPAASP